MNEIKNHIKLEGKLLIEQPNSTLIKLTQSNCSNKLEGGLLIDQPKSTLIKPTQPSCFDELKNVFALEMERHSLSFVW